MATTQTLPAYNPAAHLPTGTTTGRKSRRLYPAYNPNQALQLGTPPTDDARLTGADADLGQQPDINQPATASVSATGLGAQATAVSQQPMGESGTFPVYNLPSGFSAAQAYQRLLTTPVEDENGRLRSGGAMALEGLHEGAQSGSLPVALGEGLGGLISGLIRPQADEELQRARLLPRYKAAADEETAQAREQQAALDQARINETNAQTAYLQTKPQSDKAKQDAQALLRQQTALRSELKMRMQNPRAFDPSDAYDSDLQQRAQAGGISFDPRAFGDFKNPLSIEVIDPRDPSGTTKTREVYNRTTQQFEPLTSNGQPVKTGYVQPVLSSGPNAGMTPAQAKGATDREAGQAETRRHNQVTEAQGGQRVAQRGQPTTANTNARLARAANLARMIEAEKAKASHPVCWRLIQWSQTSRREAHRA
jgi:hypothetical protein